MGVILTGDLVIFLFFYYQAQQLSEKRAHMIFLPSNRILKSVTDIWTFERVTNKPVTRCHPYLKSFVDIFVSFLKR